MEVKVCVKCEFCWEGPDELNVTEREPCPQCGSTARRFEMHFEDKVAFHESWAGKIRDPSLPSKKKVRVEFFDGHQWSVALEKFVHKVRVLDKREDHYHEKVVDPETGELIHECTEPLSEHQGHGSAKPKGG